MTETLRGGCALSDQGFTTAIPVNTFSFGISGIKPLVEDKLFAVIPRCETIWIKILFMLSASCSESGSDTNIQSSVVHTAHDVNISSYWHRGVFVSFSLLRPAAGFIEL
jgi:hypothetical protein